MADESPVPIKPGYKTTEFWLAIVTAVITGWATLEGHVSEQTFAIISTLLTSLYLIARTWAKTA